MKKKIILISLMLVLFACLLAIGVSAATPDMYIEFGARFPGSDEYITVYTQNAGKAGNPQIDFATYKFYSDVEFTQEVDMSTATGIDFSVAKTHGCNGKVADRMTKPSAPFVNCVEVKWFLEGFPTVSYNGSFFKGWTGLKHFDFGNATAIHDNTFEGCGLESITIPATVTSIGGSAFKNCVSLKSVKIEGNITKQGNGDTFNGCTALETVDLGPTTTTGKKMFSGCTSLKTIDVSEITYFGASAFENCTSLTSVEISSNVTTIKECVFKGCTSLTSVKLNEGVPYVGQTMFSGCTSLASVSLPTTITEIKSNAFTDCKALTSITIPENVTSLGSQAFLRSGITSLHIPAKVTSIGYQVAELTPITSLTFAENSQLTFIDHRAFSDCDSLVGPVILPDGLVTIDYGLFSGSAKLKAVKMPDSVTTFTGDGALFSQCSSLEFVQFSKNLTSTIAKSMFEGCTSLKAISFPDGVTTIEYKALRSCTSLQAVYLPSGLTNLGRISNWKASDWGVFYQSPNVYLVNEPFDVFDGDTLIGDKFVMPAKPEVYYMPSGLTVVGNSEFQDCTNLNDYIVFPVGVTSIADCSQGAFFNIGKNRASNPVTLVFLGDMTTLQIRQNETSYSNIHYVFANPNDVDLSCVAVTIGAANNKNQTNTYMYFCAGKVSYDLSTFKTANGVAYTVQETDYEKTTYTEETQPHFADIKKSVFTAPTCVDNKKETSYCFCGAKIGTTEKENTSLGHEHSIFVGLIYESYLKEGYYGYRCERCEDVNKDETAPALFICLGFSASKTGNGISLGFRVNAEAVDVYTSETGKTLKYGVFAVSQSKLGENDIFDENGDATEGVISAEIQRTDFAAFDIKVLGFETDTQKTALLALGAYVEVTKDGVTEYSYMQNEEPGENEKYSFTSYSTVVQ